MNEKWLPIKGFENYLISNLGRVKVIERVVAGRFGMVTRKKRFVKQSQNCGYFVCRLHNSEGYKMFRVHRLVALHFIPNPKNKPFVNHLDSDRKNNNSKNLEWCTHQENVDHAKKNNRLRVGEQAPSAKLTSEQVIHIRTKLSHLKLKEVAKIYNISLQAVSHIRLGYSWSQLKV